MDPRGASASKKGKSNLNFLSFDPFTKCKDHQLLSSARLQNFLLVVTANVPKAMMAPDRTTSWCNDVFKPDLAQFLATTRQTHWLAENISAFLVEGGFMLSNFKNSCICLMHPLHRKHKIVLQQSYVEKYVAPEVDKVQCSVRATQTSDLHGASIRARWCISSEMQFSCSCECRFQVCKC